jgi:D-lactate dehydrogenase
MKMTVYSAQSYDERFLNEAFDTLPDAHSVQRNYQKARLTAETVALAEGAVAVCVFVNDVLSADVLQALSTRGVKAVLLRCAGFNNVDLAMAKRLGFFVARVPSYSPEAVAEHTLALVMTLNRHTHRAYLRVREGNFMLEGLLGSTLHGKTIGIIGIGKIGLAVARIFKGIGCRVLGYDPSRSPEFERIGEHFEREAVLAQADIVTLHCPLTDDTRHLINANTLSTMKPGAMLVNTSRGALIDTPAVIAALKTRHLGSLAIDVYEQESELFFHDRSSDIIDDDIFERLMTFPNVLVTGHQGFFTIEAMREIANVTMHNWLCFSDGTYCENLIPQH